MDYNNKSCHTNVLNPMPQSPSINPYIYIYININRPKKNGSNNNNNNNNNGLA